MPDDEATLPLDELLRAIEAEDRSAVRALAEEMHYADLAHAYQELDEDKHHLFLKTIGPEVVFAAPATLLVAYEQSRWPAESTLGRPPPLGG